MDHLYVMQSADGFFKIGRSKHPEQRRKELQHERWCAVVLVAQFADRGDEEQAILDALHEHRHRGEWFHDRHALRTLLVTLFGELKFKPHKGWDRDPRTDPDAAMCRWLEKQEAERRRKDSSPRFKPLVKARWDLASFPLGSPAG